jgi:hypothetical protein
MRQIGIASLLGFIAFIPGYFFANFMENQPFLLLCFSIGLSILFFFIFPTFPWIWIKFLLLLIVNINAPLRSDLWITLKRGRWWWKEED